MNSRLCYNGHVGNIDSMAAINIKMRSDPGIDLTGWIYEGENNFPANMWNDVHLGRQD